MITMTATEASRGFSALLDRVERDGEEVIVTRDGKPVARVAPENPAEGRFTYARFQKALAPYCTGDPDFTKDVLEATSHLLPPEDPWGDDYS